MTISLSHTKIAQTVTAMTALYTLSHPDQTPHPLLDPDHQLLMCRLTREAFIATAAQLNPYLQTFSAPDNPTDNPTADIIYTLTLTQPTAARIDTARLRYLLEEAIAQSTIARIAASNSIPHLWQTATTATDRLLQAARHHLQSPALRQIPPRYW